MTRLTDNQTRIISALQRMHDSGVQTSTIYEICKAMQYMRASPTLVSTTLHELLKMGLVVRSDPPKGTRKRGLLYAVTDEGRKLPCLSYKELYKEE